MGAMLGVVLSENLLLLLTFWELTSLSSFLLIGFWGARSDARKGARMALAVTGGVPTTELDNPDAISPARNTSPADAPNSGANVT